MFLFTHRYYIPKLVRIKLAVQEKMLKMFASLRRTHNDKQKQMSTRDSGELQINEK